MLPRQLPRAVSLSSPVRRPARSGQCRAIWFGSWMIDRSSDAHHQCLRRQRYRYMESLNRRLTWNDEPRPADSQPASRTPTSFAQGTSGSPPSHKRMTFKSWLDDTSGVRPGRTIEDAEREAVDHLFKTTLRGRPRRPEHWSTIRNIRDYWHGKRTPKDFTPASIMHATASTGDVKPERAKSNSLSRSDVVKPATARHATVQQAAKPGADLDKYRPLEWNDPPHPLELASEKLGQTTKSDQKAPSRASSEKTTAVADDASPRQHYDLEQHVSMKDVKDHWIFRNDPDRMLKDGPEQTSEKYDDLHRYKPVTWNEPDGLPKASPEELSKNYDDVNKYGPVTWNEPDGLAEPTPEERSKQYDDLNVYRKPFVAADSILEAHQGQQQDPSPKAHPVPSKADLETPVVNPAEEYKDLHRYGPVEWNEPDGLAPLTPEELSKNYDDLDKYAQYSTGGRSTLRNHRSETSTAHDGSPKQAPQSDKISPGKQMQATENHRDHVGNLDGANSSANSIRLEEAAKSPEDLVPSFSKTVKPGGPSGNVTAEAGPMGSTLDAYDDFQQSDAGLSTAAEIRNDVMRRAHRIKKLAMLQSSTEQPERGHGAASAIEQQRQQQPNDDDADQHGPPLRRSMTGNYAKDFPEEFSTSWCTSNSWSKSTLYPKNLADKNAPRSAGNLGPEKEEAGLSSMDESFPSEGSRLQPALDRNAGRRNAAPSAMSHLEKMQAEKDPYAKTPKGLEMSYEKECGGKATWPAFVRHHKGEATGAPETERGEPAGGPSWTASVASAEEKQPVQYKMLAYDSGTQSISVAETSSRVHYEAPLATPAEVLLRLSNPSKFFPYFSALQREGYEMASGGGDVLVFRKVRSEKAGGVAVNPIDMMGRSGASNFASPTGYVNYESPQYRAAGGVRQQETHGRSRTKKKRSLGRKLVMGTVWVAGTAYAVSVVGEYFSTGGGGKLF